MKRKNNNVIFLLTMCLVLGIGLSSCKAGSHQNGFSLQRFFVVNEQLNDIIEGINDSAFILKNEDEVLVLMLNIIDSVPVFNFTSAPQKSINDYYIFSSNSRIIGYIEKEIAPTQILLLSNINSRVDFELVFYKFIIPTLDKKRFDYIYFPDNQYTIDEKGHGRPPAFFDPVYYRFEYINNEIVPMTKLY